MAVSGNVGEVQTAEPRVLPYQFEPPSRSRNRQEANATHILANDGYDRLGNSTWCECGNCAVIDKVEECNCCTESHEIMQKLTSRSMTSHVDFYHYTSRSGLDGIISSGYIRRNSAHSRHAHFGPGTYGTSMPPSCGKYTIAENNWTPRHGPNYIRSGSVDFVIKVKIPSKEVRRVGGSRDIFLHEGPIYLKDYECEKMEVPASSTISLSYEWEKMEFPASSISLSRDLDDVMVNLRAILREMSLR